MRRALPVLLALAAGGCAGRGPPSTGMVSMPADPGRDGERDTIRLLDGKIGEYRRELGLGPEPSPSLVQELAATPPLRMDLPGERAGADETCDNVCDLARHICRAQEDICRIAAELGDDDWAQGKCNSAKASCAEARRRCSDCQPRE